MKIKTIPVPDEVLYECDRCEETYEDEEDALKCELSHICEHKNCKYEMQWMEGSNAYYYAKCKDCDTKLEEESYGYIGYNQGVMKLLYEYFRDNPYCSTCGRNPCDCENKR